MFDTIRQQMNTIEEYLLSIGFNHVSVHNMGVTSKEVFVTISTIDDFQENIPFEQKDHQFSYGRLAAGSLPDLWEKLYAFPLRPAREINVLCRQLAGVSGMEQHLRSAQAARFVLPIIEALEDLRKQLPGPREIV